MADAGHTTEMYPAVNAGQELKDMIDKAWAKMKKDLQWAGVGDKPDKDQRSHVSIYVPLHNQR